MGKAARPHDTPSLVKTVTKPGLSLELPGDIGMKDR
jgi:hypothetical protein